MSTVSDSKKKAQRVRKQPIIELYFESENELKFYNLEAWGFADCWKSHVTAQLYSFEASDAKSDINSCSDPYVYWVRDSCP